MKRRCEIYWSRFVASQLNAQNARSEDERIVWLQMAEIWLTLTRAEHAFAADAGRARKEERPLVLN
jgi:hypothetical protein